MNAAQTAQQVTPTPMIASSNFVYSPLDLFTVESSAAGTTLASASQAAAGNATTLLRNVCKRVGISLAAPVAGQIAPVGVVLRDSATGTTTSGVTIKKIWNLSVILVGINVAANVACLNIDEDELNIQGSTNTAMTLEFLPTGSGWTTPVAASTTGVTLQGYVFPQTPTKVTQVN